MNNLIGVSGGIKCGKDLVGQMLQYIGECYIRNGFSYEPTFKDFKPYVPSTTKYEIKKCADKLKDCICLLIGCSRRQLEDQEFKSKGLGENWTVYKLHTDYYPETMDSEYFDIHSDTELFASYEEAQKEGEHLQKQLTVKDPRVGYSSALEFHIETVELTPRDLLQLFGTQGGRMVVHPNIWVNALFSDYISYSARGSDYEFEKSHWIITDVRFPNNEGKAILDRGGLMIGVKRHFALRFPEYAYLALEDRPYDLPTKLRAKDPDLFNQLTHESETAMGDHSWCDWVIENNGTVEELFTQVLLAVTKEQEIKAIKTVKF